jgi:hypothetical protein
MKISVIALTATSTALVACSSVPQMTERALMVQVHRQNSVLLDKCKRLGPVTTRGEGSATFNAPNASPDQLAIYAAEIQAREQVLNMGGDTLVLLQTDLVSVVKGLPAAVFTMQLQGIALKCN